MKIAVAGTGYVGLSLAVLLAQHHEVVALDVIQEKVDLLNAKKSPIHDNEIQDFLDNRALNLTGTLDKELAYKMPTLSLLLHPPIMMRKPITSIPNPLNRSLAMY